jgi:hypothetical protein
LSRPAFVRVGRFTALRLPDGSRLLHRRSSPTGPLGNLATDLLLNSLNPFGLFRIGLPLILRGFLGFLGLLFFPLRGTAYPVQNQDNDGND